MVVFTLKGISASLRSGCPARGRGSLFFSVSALSRPRTPRGPLRGPRGGLGLDNADTLKKSDLFPLAGQPERSEADMPLRVKTTITGVQGAPYVNTLHFLGEDQSAADAAASAVRALWDGMKGKIANDCAIQVDRQVTRFTESGSIVGAFTAGAQAVVVGTDTLELAPPSLQGLISWRTGVFSGNREVRGRMFVPGVTTGAINEGVVDSPYAVAIQTAVDAFIAGATVPSIWSPTKSLLASITSGLVWTQFAVLRSRRD